MNKVTYLFGAGASADVVPIVKDIPQSISDQIEFIYELKKSRPEIPHRLKLRGQIIVYQKPYKVYANQTFY